MDSPPPYPNPRMNFTSLAHVLWLTLISVAMAGSVRAGEPSRTKNPSVQEEALGTVPNGLKASTLQISPDGKHFAGVMVHGDKWTVYVDGIESFEYDAVTENSIHFSPDSKRVAYGAMRDGKGLVVVDGKEFPAGLACAKGFPVFDATGEHFLYVAAQAGNRAGVMVDGKDGGVWEALMQGSPAFCPDGDHFVYVAKDGEGARAVVDGAAGPVYDHIAAPTFGPGCKHLAYVALTRDASILVVDGKELVTASNFVRGSFGFDSPTRLHILSIDDRGKITRLQLDLATPSRGD